MSLLCSGQGVACTCRKIGFESRRRCFPFLCTVFIYFFCLVFVFPFCLFSFILTADHADHALESGVLFSPLKQLNSVFSMLVDTMTHSTPQTVLVYTQLPPVIRTHWRNLSLPFVNRLNHEYCNPKISTGFVKKTY